MAGYVLDKLVPPEGPGVIVIWGPWRIDDAEELEMARLSAKLGAEAGRCFVGDPAIAAILGVSPCQGEPHPKLWDCADWIRMRPGAVPGGEVAPADLERLIVGYFPLKLRTHSRYCA